MNTFLARWLIGLGFCSSLLLAGCVPMGGAARYPGSYPVVPPGGGPPITYLPNPGGIPSYPGGPPSIPVVVNPSPIPGTLPGTPWPPSTPNPGTTPGTTPTIPIGMHGPEVPDERSLHYWSPWPLPPRASSPTAEAIRSKSGLNVSAVGLSRSRGLLNSQSAALYHLTSQEFSSTTGESEAVIGNGSASAHDLKYRGGRVIRDLYYVNLYISGDTNWSRTDIEQIDANLSAAMQDPHLNNVLLQYFNNQSINSTALPSHPLVGYIPNTVTRGDIQNILEWLHRQGFLQSFDLQNTVFNLLLPSGTVLTANNNAAIAIRDQSGASSSNSSGDRLPPSEEGDSWSGLAGYHGSVVTATDDRVYYTVSVYSQRGASGKTQGIPAFAIPWKNVVATLYHQLIESRTDPDVEEAIRHTANGNAEQYLGWVSDSGLELGDVPIRSNIPLTSVFREVPLANGTGNVPIQLPYSNAIHGPEGPIAQPHPLP